MQHKFETAEKTNEFLKEFANLETESLLKLLAGTNSEIEILSCKAAAIKAILTARDNAASDAERKRLRLQSATFVFVPSEIKEQAFSDETFQAMLKHYHGDEKKAREACKRMANLKDDLGDL